MNITIKQILKSLLIIPYVYISINILIKSDLYHFYHLKNFTFLFYTTTIGFLFITPFIILFYKALNKDTNKKADNILLLLSLMVSILISFFIGVLISKAASIQGQNEFFIDSNPLIYFICLFVINAQINYFINNKSIKKFFHSLSNLKKIKQPMKYSEQSDISKTTSLKDLEKKRS